MFRTLTKQSIGLVIGAILAWVAIAGAAQVAASWQPAPLAQDAPVVVAAAPVAPVLHYQGRLLDPTTGQPKPDGGYAMTFRLYGVAAAGSALWTESKSITVTKGLFTTLLGDTTALDLAHFDGRVLYLGVSVGADPEAVPRQRIAFVAYSLYAANADKLDGQEAAAFAPVVHTHNGAAITTGAVAEPFIDPAIARDSEIAPAVQASGSFAAASHTHNGAAITTGAVAEPFIDPAIARDAEVLPTVLGGDGAGSTLDADLLDGQDATAFASTSHTHPEFSLLPIAFAYIDLNGGVVAGTPNVTSVWNSTLQNYEITIAGESYFYSDYATVVTTSCDSTYTQTDSVSGNLLVEIQNNSGVPVQCNFQFVTFKP